MLILSFVGKQELFTSPTLSIDWTFQMSLKCSVRLLQDFQEAILSEWNFQSD